MVVFGRGGRDISQSDAMSHVAGYSIGIDFTARDLIEVSGMARAVVYRKLIALKQSNWIKEHWQDQKLCYTTSTGLDRLVGSLNERFS